MRAQSNQGRDDVEASWIARLIFGGLLALILVAPWPWGGNTPVVRSGLGIATGLLFAAWALASGVGQASRPPFSATARGSLMLWIAWLSWIGLQLVPMPAQLLQELSPRSFGYHENIRQLHESPLYTLSIAPTHTAAALLDSAALFSVYCLSLLLASSQKRIRILLSVVFFSGLAQALYGIHMAATGMEYGFFEKKLYGIGSATGTFFNRNHFAAYLEIAGSAGIGLVLMDLGRWTGGSWRSYFTGFVDLLFSAKFRTRVLLVIVVVGIVMSRSRMGNVAFFSALSLTGLIYVLLRMRTSLLPALFLFFSFALVDLWVVSQWFGLDKVVERIEQTDIEREQRPLVLQDLLPAMEAYALTGAGMGTFAQAYSPFRSIEVHGYYDHAHNEYAEFIVETGWPGLGILALLVAVHLVHAIRILILRRRSIYAGAAFACLMSSIAILIHATTEFMLRMPAVALNWVVLLAVCASISSRSQSPGKPESVTAVTSVA